MSDTDTELHNPPTVPDQPDILPPHWENYTERVNICSVVIATILDLLTENPMVAPMLGPEFQAVAREQSGKLKSLTNDVGAYTPVI